MNEKIDKIRELKNQFDLLQSKGVYSEEEEETLMIQMDDTWYSMSKEEQEKVRDFF